MTPGSFAFPELRARAHEALVEQFRMISRTLPNGVVEEGRGWVMASSGLPYAMFNRLFVMEPPVAAPAILGRARAFFGERGVPWSMCAAPEATNTLGPCADAAGLQRLSAMPTMLLLPGAEPPRMSEGVSVRRVGDGESEAFIKTAARSFGAPRVVFEAFGRPPVADSPGVCNYLGFVDGEPVATATLVTSARIAGLYNVGTIPRARGKGIGTAMTWRAASDGFSEGCLASALQSSLMGFGVYQRIGFQHAFDYSMWEARGESARRSDKAARR